MGLDPDLKITLVQTLDEALDMRRWLGERREFLAVDVETSGLNLGRDDIRLFQVGDTRRGFALSWEDWKGVVKETLPAYSGSRIAFHNASFDAALLRRDGVRLREDLVDDTMIMAHLVNSGGRIGLKPVAAKLIGRFALMGQGELEEAFQKYGWDWDTVPIDYPAYWHYGTLDTCLTAAVAEELWPQVDAEYRQIYEVEMASIFVLCAARLRGMRVDLDYVRETRAQMQSEMAELEASVFSKTGLAPSKDAQVRDYLERIADRGPLGSWWPFRTEKGMVSVDDDALKYFEEEFPAVITPLRRWRRCNFLVGHYFDNILRNHVDGVVRPNIRQVLRTGRMSITDPPLQTLPRGTDVRDAFVPREGNKILQADFQQAELRVFAYYSQCRPMIEAFKRGEDLHKWLASYVYHDGDQHAVTKPQRQVSKNVCVPTKTDILTVDGWKHHDQVQIGDLVLGAEDGHLRWQRVLGVHHDRDRVVRFGHSFMSFEATLDHRWLVEKRRRKYWTENGRRRSETVGWSSADLMTTADFLKNNDVRLRLSLPCDEAGWIDITPDEAALIAWSYTDGQVRTGRTKRANSLTIVSLFQSEHKFFSEMMDLINRLGVTVAKHFVVEGTTSPMHSIRLDSQYCHRLWKRAGLLDGLSLSDVVLGLSPEARREFLQVCYMAEGDAAKREVHGEFRSLSQNSGETAEAMKLAMFLSGEFPLVKKFVSRSGKQAESIRATRTIFTSQTCKTEELEEQDVWCVETELGTWVARQDDKIFLTGNSFARIYGAGDPKIASTAGVDVSVITEFQERYNRLFPEANRFMQSLIGEMHRRKREEGSPYVKTILGRKLVIDDDKMYAGTNYLCQCGATGDVLKLKIAELDAAGVGDYLMLPVHDELLFDVPEDEVECVEHVVKEVMPERKLFGDCHLTIDTDVLNRWGDHYRDPADRR